MPSSAKNGGGMSQAHSSQTHRNARHTLSAMAWKAVMLLVGLLAGLAGGWDSSAWITPDWNSSPHRATRPDRATTAGWPEVVSSCLSHQEAAAGEMQAPDRWAPEYRAPSSIPSIRALDITRRPPNIPHDLRRPRPPRHRSERPSTGLALLSDLLIVELLEFLDDSRGGRFVPFPVASLPLPGHPSAILRPPSPRG